MLTSVSHKKQHRPQRHLPLFLSLVNAWLLHSHKCVSETLSNWIIVKKTGTQYYVYFVIITPLNAFYHFYVNLMVLFFLFIFRWKKDFSVRLYSSLKSKSTILSLKLLINYWRVSTLRTKGLWSLVGPPVRKNKSITKL